MKANLFYSKSYPKNDHVSALLALGMPMLCSFQLVFNHPALTCVVRDNRGDWPGREAATAPLGVAHLADLALPAMGLLRLDVRVCVPWEASSALESASRSGGSLQLSQARALMRWDSTMVIWWDGMG